MHTNRLIKMTARNMRRHGHIGAPRKQQGVVLVVALILLLILTLLGLASVQSTSLQEKMAGNQRQQQLAFEAAEAALRQGELSLAGLATLPPFDGSTLGYYANSTDSSGNTLAAGTDWSTWNWTKAIPYSGNLSIGGGSSSKASYYIEQYKYVAAAGQTLDASAPIPGAQLYAITARGRSPDLKSTVILQSTYKR